MISMSLRRAYIRTYSSKSIQFETAMIILNPITTCPISFHIILSHYISSSLSNPIQSHLVLSHLISSHLIASQPILFFSFLLYSILSFPFLFYSFLFFSIRFCSILYTKMKIFSYHPQVLSNLNFIIDEKGKKNKTQYLSANCSRLIGASAIVRANLVTSS